MPALWDSDDDWRRLVDSTGFTPDNLGDNSPIGSLSHAYSLGSLTKGLVAYYPMDSGQGRVLFDGATGNHGQINGATWNGSGQVGGDCLSFDGSDDRTDAPTDTIHNFPVGTAVAGWFKPPSSEPSSNQCLFGRFEDDGSAIRWAVTLLRSDLTEDIEVILYDGTNSLRPRYNASFWDGNWHHVAAVRRTGTTVDLYIDGTEVAVNSYVSQTDVTPNITGPFRMGDERQPPTYPFNGELDDVRVYDRQLSQPEIDALANLTTTQGREVTESDVPSQGDNGVSRYEFENDVTDSWGSNDGTDNTSAGYVTGVYGSAKDFDGTDDIVEVAGPDPFPLPFTISTWVNADTIKNGGSTTDGQFIYRIRTSGDDYTLSNHNNGNWKSQLWDNSASTAYAVSSSKNTDTDSWVNLTSTYDGSELRLYIGGSLTGETSVGSSFDLSSNSIGIGDGPSNDRQFDGQIDDVRIYSTALTPSEVEQLYNLGAWRINRGDVL